jgi:glycerol kinase
MSSEYITRIPRLLSLGEPVTIQLTRGAAYLAGLGVGFWQSRDDLPVNQDVQRYTPNMVESTRDQLYDGWQEAVGRSRGWERRF